MKKNYFFFTKEHLKVLAIIILIAAIIGLPSCKNMIKPLNTPNNCITIPRHKINALLKSGWNTPGNKNFMPLLCFEPFGGPGNTITAVNVFATDKDAYVNPNKSREMDVNTTCTIPGGLLVLKNYYKFEDFADANGDLKKFTFLRLIPKICPADSTKMSFDVQIVNSSGGIEATTAKGETWPCPDYCCPGPKCPYQYHL